MDIIRRVFRILITGYIVKAIRNLISGKSGKSNNGNGNDNENKEK
ncbi:SAR1012 family small protein [Staphylococcus capitis]|nr:SAR1012 family small protein [Staphylococcus capitis]